MSTKNIIIDPGTGIDQIERDKLPDHQGVQGIGDSPRRTRNSGLPWQAWLGLFVGVFSIIGYLVVRFVQWLSDLSYATSWLDVYLVALIKTALFLTPILTAGVCLFWLFNKAAAARIIRLQNNMPVARRHIERDDWQPIAVQSLGAFYSTQRVWAEHSDYRSLNQLDLSRSFTGKAAADVIDAPIIAPAPALPITPNEGPIIEQLRAKGHINRSPDGSMLVGFNGEQKPMYLRWGKAGLSAVAGGSGSGKTSTVRLLAAQHAMNGGALILCDGHGEAGEQSLIQSCSALDSAYLFEPAISDDAIYQTICTVDRIGRDRLTGASSESFPIVLIIDEFTSLVRNHKHAAEIVNVLVNAGDEWRKVNLMAVVIGHHWRGDLIDGKLGGALRAAIGARLLHRTAIQEARFLLRAEEAQSVDRLRDGECLFFDGGAEPARLTVPFVDAGALLAAQRYIPAHLEWPLVLSAGANNSQIEPRPFTMSEQQRRDLLIALRKQGFKRDEARSLFNLSFNNDEWAEAGLSV